MYMYTHPHVLLTVICAPPIWVDRMSAPVILST